MKKGLMFILSLILVSGIAAAQDSIVGNTYVCNNNSDCPTEKPYCLNGTCRSYIQSPNQPYPCSTNSDCPPGLWCYANHCQAFEENRPLDDREIVAPEDNQCDLDKDCGFREVCHPQTKECVSTSTTITCNLNTDCPQEWFCSNKICRQYINPPNQPYPENSNLQNALIIAGAIIIGFILLGLILRRKKKRY